MEYDNIRIQRVIHRLTQADASEIFHISQQTLSMIETGKREPSIPLLIQMAEYYDVSVDYLIGHTVKNGKE